MTYSAVSIITSILFADVEPWTFEQNLGEAVFIPAGCPHQVRNRQVSYWFKYKLFVFLHFKLGMKMDFSNISI